MRSVRIDEVVFDHGFYRNTKFKHAGIAATGLFVCAVAASHREGRDGIVPHADLIELGTLNDLGISEGVLTGLYAPATHELLARRLVQSGLFHEVPGGYTIHDYADYQETTLGRQMRRHRDARRQRKRRSSDVTAESQRSHGATPDTPSPRATAEDLEVPTFVKPSSALTAPGAAVENSNGENPLQGDYGDLEAFRRLAAGLRDADARTPIVLASVSRGLPESEIARAVESLRKRRSRKPALASEARYLVATLKSLKDERQEVSA